MCIVFCDRLSCTIFIIILFRSTLIRNTTCFFSLFLFFTFLFLLLSTFNFLCLFHIFSTCLEFLEHFLHHTIDLLQNFDLCHTTSFDLLQAWEFGFLISKQGVPFFQLRSLSVELITPLLDQLWGVLRILHWCKSL